MKRLLLIFTSLLSLSGVVRAQAPVKRELLEMTELSERRIRQSVQDYLGPDTRTVVSVYLKERVPLSQVPETTTEQVLADSNWMLSGPYVPANPTVEATESTSGSFEVDSAEVSIQVEKIVDVDARKEIERLAKAILRGIPVKVSVASNLAPPVAQIEKDRKAEEASRSPASIANSVDDALEKFTKRYGPFAPLAAAFLILAGVMFVALMLRSSAREIADGLKSMRPAVSNSGSQTISLSAPAGGMSQVEHKGSTTALPGADPRRAALPPSPSMGMEVRRNLQAIESYLMQSPLLFVRSVTDDPGDLMGLKFLVSKFSDEARTKLKELIGVERLLKASSYQASEEVVGFNAGGWLQQLIEKIELKKLAGGSVVEEALSNDESLLLSNAAQENILDAALKVNTPAAWRVATDFLPSEFMKKRGPEFDRQMWSNVVKGALVADSKEVHEAARQLIDIVRVSVSENVVMYKATRERDEHFSKRLLPSLIDTILSQDLGEDDEFIGFIVAETPEFARSIRSTVWTPARLTEVSDDSLKQIFMGLDNEKRAYLIFAFPEAHAKRMESYLPDGNMKKIVTDIVARLRTTADQALKERTRALAREFLDYLRVQVANGVVQLKEGALDAAAPRRQTEAAVAEVVDVELDESQRKAS